jgi:hypothetical protein
LFGFRADFAAQKSTGGISVSVQRKSISRRLGRKCSNFYHEVIRVLINLVSIGSFGSAVMRRVPEQHGTAASVAGSLHIERGVADIPDPRPAAQGEPV